MGKQTPIVKYLFDNNLMKDAPYYDKLILQLLILQEKRNPESKLRNFLDSIPKDWSSFPVLFSQEELKHLEGSALFS